MLVRRHVSRSALTSLAVAGLVCSATGCERRSGEDVSEKTPESAEAEREALEAGWYRVVVQSGDTDDIPFYLHLPAEGDEAIVQNGPQELRAPVVRDDASAAMISYEIYHTSIRLHRDDDAVRGAFESSSNTWGESSLDLVAERVEGPEPTERFAPFDEGDERVDASGIWRAEFLEGSGDARLDLEQDDEVITGTIHFQTGNFVLLAGNVHGSQARLSAFDGSTPYLMILDLEGDELDGHWAAGPELAWQEGFFADRVDELDWKPRVGAGILPTALELPQLDDEKYEGKPVIVELAGSWCATCQYAAPVMRRLYERYHERGLEILTLNYEFTSDEAYNQRQAEKYKERYGIPWDVVPVHGELDEYAEIMPPGLETVNAAGFPVAIFLAPDRTIRGINAGFPSPAAEDAHAATAAEYERMAAELFSDDE